MNPRIRPMDFLAARHQNFLRQLNPDAPDAFLVTSPTNVRYLTGFTGSSGYAFITPKKITLISDGRYEEQIAEECKGLDVVIRPHNKSIAEQTGEVLTKHGAKTVGIESDHVSVALFESLKEKAAKATLVPLSGKVEALRCIKDSAEIEAIREAIAVAERAFKIFLALLRPNDTEKELADCMEMLLRRSGAKCSSFAPIVAIGERGALPHGQPSEKKVHEGSKLLVDWGADLGYKSDITRSFPSPFPLDRSKKFKSERRGHNFEAIFAAVLASHRAAVEQLRPGTKCKDVDAVARTAMTKSSPKGIDLNDHFTHGLGHGIGLDIHEGPSIRQNSDDELQAGNVVTIEPGVYLPGWGGIRIEDDYLVTRDGPVRLTTLPQEPAFLS